VEAAGTEAVRPLVLSNPFSSLALDLMSTRHCSQESTGSPEHD
jgi:hypothetical protein